MLSFNEVAGISHLLPGLLSHTNHNINEIFAVDGGSSDGTLKVYEKFGIPVQIQKNPGRGHAIQWAAILAKNDYIILFSPDGNEDFRDIDRFSELFSKGYDLVIASRMMKGAANEEDIKYFKWRKWANLLLNRLANLLFNTSQNFVSDSINGFRGFKKNLINELSIDATGYDIEYQMTIRCLIQKKKIYEFPTIEGQRIGGYSKAYALPTGIKFIVRLIKELQFKNLKSRSS